MTRQEAGRERPILFAGPMVRAILTGTKTQTRRVVKRDTITKAGIAGIMGGTGPAFDLRRCPYGLPGSRLWVREAFSIAGNEDGHPVTADGTLCDERDALRLYRADTEPGAYGLSTWPNGAQYDGAWRPSIHMPRWASRLSLVVEDVRVERLQEISEADVLAEGVVVGAERDIEPPVWTFARGWDSINGKRPGAAWADNPWVWVVTFRKEDEQ